MNINTNQKYLATPTRNLVSITKEQYKPMKYDASFVLNIGVYLLLHIDNNQEYYCSIESNIIYKV